VGEIGSSETLEAREVGLEAGAPLPFEFRPSLRPSPLVISFPHVGLDWPQSLGPRPQVNFPRNADYAVDRLYVRAEALGAATIRARFSRLVVDLNRAEDDVSPELVPDHPAPRPRASLSSRSIGETRRPIRNRGVVWRSAVGNIPLLSTLSHAQFSGRIARFHRPYYRALELLIERRRRRFGYAVVLDAHSMPGSVAGDLVLGTRSGSACGSDLRELAMRALSGKTDRQRLYFGSRWPLGLAVDDPYRGGQIIGTFGRPETHIHALQLEVSRALYMDELRLEPAPLPDLGELERPVGSQTRSRGSRGAQAQQRERRRLLALISAIDSLVMELSVERPHLAERAAAE
jgi:N-formylglutamate deformylase